MRKPNRVKLTALVRRQFDRADRSFGRAVRPCEIPQGGVVVVTGGTGAHNPHLPTRY